MTLLREWQNRLGLQDWRIKLCDKMRPDDMRLQDVVGDTEDEETTIFITDFGGNYVTWATCLNCGRSVQYPTEHPYTFCPYCSLRIIYDKEENQWQF